jgi:cytoskeletal protein CcmA (bactofilin family)
MPHSPENNPPPGPAGLDLDADFDEMQQAGRKGLLGRLGSSLNEKLQTSRGDRRRDAVAELAPSPSQGADDLALRRARTVVTQKMVIPEGVIIQGNLSGGTETEIGGRIEGDITVDGRLYLGASALVTGNVRAGSCRIEGLVEGKVECGEDLELGKTGRLNGDVVAGKRINLAGQVYGNVTASGGLRLAEGSQVTGNLRTRNLVIEEGAVLNGSCAMRPPAERPAGAK